MYRQRLSSLLSDKDQLQRDNEDLSSEIGQWRKKCLHMEKSFEVRDFEGRQAIEFVITELTQVDRQLKGDHSVLQHVIAKLNDLMTSQQHQHHNGGAGLGSGNPVVLVLYELLEIFKVMIRQLKLTQKEMKRYRQQQQQHQETLERQRSRSPMNVGVEAQKVSQSSNFYNKSALKQQQNQMSSIVTTVSDEMLFDHRSEYLKSTKREKSSNKSHLTTNYDLPLKRSIA